MEGNNNQQPQVNQQPQAGQQPQANPQPQYNQQPQYREQQYYQQPQFNGQHYYPQQAYDPTTKPMTLGDWILTYLLLLIPGLNIVLVFVWAFSSRTNKSKKSFFQLQLILIIISVILSIIFYSVILDAINSIG